MVCVCDPFLVPCLDMSFAMCSCMCMQMYCKYIYIIWLYVSHNHVFHDVIPWMHLFNLCGHIGFSAKGREPRQEAVLCKTKPDSQRVQLCPANHSPIRNDVIVNWKCAVDGNNSGNSKRSSHKALTYPKWNLQWCRCLILSPELGLTGAKMS